MASLAIDFGEVPRRIDALRSPRVIAEMNPDGAADQVFKLAKLHGELESPGFHNSAAMSFTNTFFQLSPPAARIEMCDDTPGKPPRR